MKTPEGAVFERLFRRGRKQLEGAPEIRRLKTYAAQSGYVYQYHYNGYRTAGGSGREYVFEVSADRRAGTEVSVLVPAEALAGWEREHGRPLAAVEWYAIAKMALFQAFDERATPALMRKDIRLRAADVEAILDNLGID